MDQPTANPSFPPPPPAPGSPGGLPQSKASLAKVLALGVIGAVVGYCSARYLFVPSLASMPKAPPTVKMAIFGVVPLGWLLAVAWHEAGHLVGGWLGGGRFLLYLVGPLKIQRTPAGIRLGLNRSLNLFGGLAACPPSGTHNLNRRLALMAAAGPIASVALTVAGLALVQRIPPPTSTAGMIGMQILWCITGFSALIALITIWPSQAGGFKSDGARTLGLLRPGAVADAEAAMLLITSLSMSGIRARDWPTPALDRLNTLPAGSNLAASAPLLAFAHAADLEKWDEAQHHLSTAIDREGSLPAPLRVSARASQAWLIVHRGGPPDLAESWLNSAGPNPFDPAQNLLASAAIALARGQHTEAQRLAREGRVAAQKHTLGGNVSSMMVERLDTILARSAEASA